jgi:hypothetical protein
MPVFTIKAKDNLAVKAVDAYRALCVEAGLTEQAGEVVKAIGEIIEWRLAHSALCKDPDHEHVAVFCNAGGRLDDYVAAHGTEFLAAQIPGRDDELVEVGKAMQDILVDAGLNPSPGLCDELAEATLAAARGGAEDTAEDEIGEDLKMALEIDRAYNEGARHVRERLGDDDLVEGVAKAIGEVTPGLVGWDRASEDLRRRYMTQARAVLFALSRAEFPSWATRQQQKGRKR